MTHESEKYFRGLEKIFYFLAKTPESQDFRMSHTSAWAILQLYFKHIGRFYLIEHE